MINYQRNQGTTHESAYTMETMSELYDIKELPKGTFTLSFKTYRHLSAQRSLTNKKLNCAEYTKCYFSGGWNTIEIVMYNGRILTSQKLQKYVVKWYHMYLLHTGLDRTEAMVHQNLYWPGMREAVQKEFKKCGTFQCTNWLTKKW